MAYALKYELYGKSSVFKKLWKVRISGDGYTGDPINRNVPGDPFSLKKDSAGTVRGTSLDFAIRAIADFEFIEFYTENSRDWFVELIENRLINFIPTDVVIWQGYIVPEQYQEPYSPAPCTVSFTATDQLGLLKNYDYTPVSATRRSYLSVLIDCLAETGLTLGFAIAIAIMESRQNQDRSALSEIYVNPQNFSEKTCYDVVVDILSHFDAEITQQNGIWLIRRSVDKQLTRVLYDAAGTYTGTQAAPTVKILGQLGTTGTEVYPTGGPLAMDLATGERIIKITENYLLGNSVLPSQDAAYWTGDHALTGWTPVNSTIDRIDSTEPSYLIVKPPIPDEFDFTQFVKTEINEISQSDDSIVFSFDYAFVGKPYSAPPACADIAAGVELFSATLNKTWFLSAQEGWSETNSKLLIGGVVSSDSYDNIFNSYKNPTWWNYKITSDGFPADGVLTIKLFVATHIHRINWLAPQTVAAAFKNVTLNFLHESIALPVSFNYEILLNKSTKADKKEIELTGGDIPDYANKTLSYGGYTSLSDGTTTGLWTMPGVTGTALLIQLIAKLYASENRKAKQYLTGTIRGLSIDFDTVLQHNYPTTRKFEIVEASYNLCADKAEVTLVELFDYVETEFTIIESNTLDTSPKASTAPPAPTPANSGNSQYINTEYSPGYYNSLYFNSYGIAVIGDAEREQPIATRIETPTNGQFAYWEAANSRLNFKALEAGDIPELGYLTSLSGAVLTDQSTPQTIGATTARLAKLWATEIESTNMPTVGGVSLATTFAPTSVYPVTGLTTGYLPYKSSTVLANSGLYYDGVKFGIGTIPVTPLDIKTATNVHLGIQTGQYDATGIQLNAFNDGGGLNIPMQFAATKFYFNINNAPVMLINNSGLDIDGNISVSGVVTGPITTLTPTISGQAARIELLTSTNASAPTPLVIYFHGDGETQNEAFTQVDEKRVTDALIAAGYIVASSNAHGKNWGNQAGQDDYYNLYAYITGSYIISKVIFISQSMGGLASLNLIASGRIPVDTWYGIYSVTNLSNLYAIMPSDIEAAYSFSGSGAYAAATAGFDPNLYSGAVFNSVRMRMISSYSDITVPRVQNSDLFAIKVTSLVPELTIVTHSGDHGDPTAFVPNDIISFLNPSIHTTLYSLGVYGGSNWTGNTTYYGGGKQHMNTLYGDQYGSGASWTDGVPNINGTYFPGGKSGGYFHGGGGNFVGAGGAGVLAIGGDAGTFGTAGGGAGIFARGGLNGDGFTRTFAGYFDQGNVVVMSGNVGIANITAPELLTLGTPGTTAGVLSLAGATSGKAIINVSAAAGTPTLTLPTTTGTLALVSDIPGFGTDHTHAAYGDHAHTTWVGLPEDITFEFRDIVAGTSQIYNLDIKASYGYTIEAACLETDNGTLTGVAVKIGATAVTSLSNVTVDTGVDETASTGAKTVVAGNRITIVTSTGFTGAPTTLRGKIKIIRI